jgi:hypothetical protein
LPKIAHNDWSHPTYSPLPPRFSCHQNHSKIRMSEIPKGENNQLEYPKPPGWEWMTGEERFEALKAEPKPESEEAKLALREAHQQAIRAARAEKYAIMEARKAPLLVECPRCSLVLEGPSIFSLSDGSYTFRATLKYDSDPRGQDRSFIFDAQAAGLLGENAASYQNRGYYSVYPSEECTQEDRVMFQQKYCVSMRRPRGPGGRFLPHYEIESLDGWAELAPNESVSKDIHIKLDAFSSNRENILVEI